MLELPSSAYRPILSCRIFNNAGNLKDCPAYIWRLLVTFLCVLQNLWQFLLHYMNFEGLYSLTWWSSLLFVLGCSTVCLANSTIKHEFWKIVMLCSGKTHQSLLLISVKYMTVTSIKQDWRTHLSCFGKVQQSFFPVWPACPARMEHCQQSKSREVSLPSVQLCHSKTKHHKESF